MSREKYDSISLSVHELFYIFAILYQKVIVYFLPNWCIIELCSIFIFLGNVFWLEPVLYVSGNARLQNISQNVFEKSKIVFNNFTCSIDDNKIKNVLGWQGKLYFEKIFF